MNKRINGLRSFLLHQGLDAIIITKPENRRYFSGFTGSAGMLVVTMAANQLLTDFRYIEQATAQAPLSQVLRYNSSPFEVLTKVLSDLGVTKVGFEKDFVTVAVFNKFNEVSSNITWLPIEIEPLRMVKDDKEISLTKKAVTIADQAFQNTLSVIKAGVRELDVAVELEYQMRKLGSEKPAFDTIIASGKRGALPHGIASTKLMEEGDLVTLDFGAVYQGYHSDMTRTVCIGRASSRQREIYDVVLKAQLAGIQAVKPGEAGKDIDAVARRIIEANGFGQYFGHGLGHGVGLQIHEEPRLSPANTDVLMTAGMLVTVEPGIYIPGWGGIRIEDIVLVSAQGNEILTTSSKQLIELF